MKPWTVRELAPQPGRRAVITGATGGIGLETALALAGADFEVTVTGRNDDKGEIALRRIRDAHPRARVRYEHLDLASLASVKQFAEHPNHPHVHVHVIPRPRELRHEHQGPRVFDLIGVADDQTVPDARMDEIAAEIAARLG